MRRSTAQLSVDGHPVPSVLKRNQACHQCRRRKLKCDAKRPCSTCVRSHANALQVALPGANVPPHPDCTYDELPDARETRERERDPMQPVASLAPGDGGVRGRYAALETRINELQSELAQRDKCIRVQAQQLQLQMGHQPLLSNTQPQFVSPGSAFPSADSTHPPYPTPFTPLNPVSSTSALPLSALSGSFDSYSIDPSVALNGDGSPNGLANSAQLHHHQQQQQQQQDPMYSSLMMAHWPARLPSPDLLRNLIHTFFVSHPHANRLLHRPTFMASLDFPPNHPNFPSLSLLHAICALASIWSPLVESEGLPDLHSRPAEEIFLDSDRARLKEERARLGLGPDVAGDLRGEWFGEAHAKWSREEEEKGAAEGVGVFQGLQSIVILTWYYYAHARWVEVWLYTSKALRYAVPMGLNVTSTHGPLLRSWTMPSILAPPRDQIEDEMRRNTFWLAYCYERWQAASTGWAMALDDEDISQVMCCRMSDYEQGIKVSTDWRQRISTPRMLTLHLPEQTDSFTLYVKGTILFSKVKNFNSRFKSKYFYAVASSSVNGQRFVVGPGPGLSPGLGGASATGAAQGQSGSVSPDGTGDIFGTLSSSGIGAPPSVGGAGVIPNSAEEAAGARFHPTSAAIAPPATVGNPPTGPQGTYASPASQGPERIDPRDTPSFRAIDNLIEAFRTSFPKDLRDPVRGGRLDSELYVACLVPHVAVILLHDPHADPSSPFDKSAEKLLNAARQILDLVYILCSTSFDVTLLDPVASFAWFLAARVFVRFLKARLEARKHAEAVGLRNELEVIRLALRRMGERIPLGFRQAKMLDDLLANEVGSSLDNRSTHSFAMLSVSASPTTEETIFPGTTSPGPNLSHRGSLAGSVAMPTPNLGPRASISSQGQPMTLSALAMSGINGLPGASISPRPSFSSQGQPMVMLTPDQQQPPSAGSRPGSSAQQHQFGVGSVGSFGGLGITRGLTVSELLQRGVPVVPGGSVGAADVHLRFVEGMAAPGEDAGPGLEMLFVEMVDDGTLADGVDGVGNGSIMNAYSNPTGLASLGAGGLGPHVPPLGSMPPPPPHMQPRHSFSSLSSLPNHSPTNSNHSHGGHSHSLSLSHSLSHAQTHSHAAAAAAAAMQAGMGPMGDIFGGAGVGVGVPVPWSS